MGGPLIRASEVVLPILHTVSHELPAQAMASKEARLRAISLYKELHRLGREYPDPAYNFHKKLRGLYESASQTYANKNPAESRALAIENRNLTDPEEIEKAIKLGEYIRNETLALYSLRKYRHLKRMYPQESPAEPFP